MEKFQEDTFLKKIEADFKLAANYDVTGFLSFVLKRKEKFYLIVQGFLPFEPLEKKP